MFVQASTEASAVRKTVFSDVVVLMLDCSSLIHQPGQQWAGCPCSCWISLYVTPSVMPITSVCGSALENKTKMTWLKVSLPIHPSLHAVRLGAAASGAKPPGKLPLLWTWLCPGCLHAEQQLGCGEGVCLWQLHQRCAAKWALSSWNNKDSRILLTLWGWIF